MPDSIDMRLEKETLRQRQLRQRKGMDSGLVHQLSRRAQSSLAALSAFGAARTVGLYAPVGNEVDTQLLCEWALARNVIVAYPCVMQQDLEFVRYSADCAWDLGALGIPEPRVAVQRSSECVVPPACFDLVVVPGVAFDRSGNRLGYGKGFYDRFLAQCSERCVFVGLAYDFQLEECLPRESHDVCLDYVVTDTVIIECMETS